ncbi:PulJ/GspJ family protein [Salimicrobium halophilum]|uniref:Prepilin-type N-terminal cleavage/methylation domain-containing protein n=1 Tax=Salimicrobium halophilum TaxID=86666 RepID=A0A1G8PJ89_9BACI|nr:prepilin-type N-terminal cleavage/methylation domain-containing protein [Salimicrobium halophilum]SDI92406.1 prepilin-type N-terminal cleavage/methylation domain-containing protein [Salimicrobium halophilum]
MYRLSNDKGITLVELLAAIALIGIIGVISFRLLTGMFSANLIAENDISLKQEANIILTSIREKAQVEDVELQVPEEESLLVNGKDVLTKDDIIITEFHAENRSDSEETVEKSLFPSNSGSSFTSEVSETLVVSMSITTKEGTSIYEISSVIPGLADPNRNYTIETPEEDDPNSPGSGGDDEDPSPEPPAYEIFTTQEEFEALDPANINGWVEGHPDSNNEYTLTENTILDSRFPRNYQGQNTFEENFWAKYDNMYLNNHNVTIEESMYVNHESIWNNNNSVKAGGNALFRDDVTIRTQSSFDAFNTYFRGNISVPNSGIIDTRGSIRVDGKTILRSQAKLKTNGYFFANGSVNLSNNTNRIEAVEDIYLNSGGTLNGASIQSGGTMNLDGGFTLQNNASLTSGGVMNGSGSMTLRSNSTLYAEDSIDLDGSFLVDGTITSEGDISIYGSVSGSGTICATGNISTIGAVGQQVKIKDNRNNFNGCK